MSYTAPLREAVIELAHEGLIDAHTLAHRAGTSVQAARAFLTVLDKQGWIAPVPHIWHTYRPLLNVWDDYVALTPKTRPTRAV